MKPAICPARGRSGPPGVRLVRAPCGRAPTPRPGKAVCVATRSSGSGSGSGGGKSRRVRREAVGVARKSKPSAEARLNRSRAPDEDDPPGSPDPAEADSLQQGYDVSELLNSPPTRPTVSDASKSSDGKEPHLVSSADGAAYNEDDLFEEVEGLKRPASAMGSSNGKRFAEAASDASDKEEEDVVAEVAASHEASAAESTGGPVEEQEQEEEVFVVEEEAVAPAVAGFGITPPEEEGSDAPGEPLNGVLGLIETSSLLRTVEDVQQKNTELQKQLNETVALLGVAARALEDRQAAQASGAMTAALGDAGTAEEEEAPAAAVGGSDEEEEDVLEEEEGRKQQPGAVGVASVADSMLDVAPEEEEKGAEACVMQHPGILCCTETSVSRDPEGSACVITMRTAAQRSGGGTSVNMPHMVALAAQAMQAQAAEFSQANNRGLAATVYTERRMDRHKQIRRVLQKGNVVEVLGNNTSQFGHENFVVMLQDPEDIGLTFKAVFKPRVEGDGNGWHRAPIEAVAYKLNLLLGMDFVPPVAYRTGGIECHFRHFEEGAFIYFAENATELREHEEEDWGTSKDVLLSNARILDVLLHNSDRHHGHILLGEHWVEGSYTDQGYQGMQRPMLIDHAAGFRKEAVVTMQHDNAFKTGPVLRVSAKTYLRLRFLDASTIASSFSKYLSEREMRDLLMRRNKILRYLDRLVETNGYDETVIETP